MSLSLLNNNDLYRLFFEHSTNHKWVRSVDGKYLIVNQSYADSLSLKKEEIIGKTNFDLMPEDLAENFTVDDRIVIEKKITSLKESSNFFKDRTLTFLILKFPLYDEHGNVCAVAGAATDVTNEKIFWQHLKQKENLLSSIIHSMGDGLLFFNSEGTLEFTNPAAEKLLESIATVGSPEEILTGLQFFPLKKGGKKGSPFPKLFPWVQALEGSAIKDHELEIRTSKNDKSMQISTNAMLVKNHNNENLGAVVVLRDITEQKILFEKIQKQSEELKLKNEALEQFAYFLAHDLREPLRTINSFIHLLANQVDTDNNPSINTYIQYIKDGGQRINKMISDLRSFCEVGSHIPLKPVNLDVCLKKALDFLKVYLHESGTKIYHALLPTVKGDETSLILLFQNLISNSIKFQNGGFPEIFITLKEEKENYIIGVKDNGIGVDPRYRKNIFLPFKRGPSKSSFQGIGLGLALCKKIIEAHNGEIWVEPNKKQGSHFKFKLKKEVITNSA